MVEQGRGDGERTRLSGAMFAMLGPAGGLHSFCLVKCLENTKIICVGTLWVACKTLLDSRFILLPSSAMNVGRNLFCVPLPQPPRSKTLCLVAGGSIGFQWLSLPGEILITKLI